MAQIPMGGFDAPRVSPQASQRVADTSPLAQNGRGMAAVGEALSQTGSTLGNMALQQRQQQTEQASALASARAQNALDAHRLDIDAAVTDVGDQLRRGAPVGEASTLYEKRVADLKPPQIEGMHPAVLERYQGQVENERRAGALKVQALATSALRDQGQAELVTTLDLNGKVSAASADPANVEQANAKLRQAGGFFVEKFGLDKSTVEAHVQSRINENWKNQARQRFEGTNADKSGLEALYSDLTGEKGAYADKLDGDTRMVLATSVRDRIGQLDASAKAEIDKRETAGERAANAAWQQVGTALPPKPEDLTGWVDAAKGTSHEAEVRAAAQAMGEVQEVLRKRPAEQDAYLQDLQGKLMKGGDVHDQARYDALHKAIEDNKRLMTEQPLVFVQNRLGMKLPDLDLQGALTKGDYSSVTAQLEQRMQVLGAAQKQFGPSVKMLPLKPQEAQALTAAIDKLPAAQALPVFTALRAAAKSDETYGALMKQLAPDAPLKARAGELAIRPGGQKTASLILRGEALLAGKGDAKVTMPPDNEFDTLFAQTVGDAYAGRPEDAARDKAAFRAVYAASIAADGQTDAGKIFDPRLASNALGAVTGTPVRIGGKTVLPPWGMTPDRFEATSEVLMRQTLAGVGYDGDDWSHYSLQATPQEGLYKIMVGRRAAVDPTRRRPDGQPAALFIDVNAVRMGASGTNRAAGYDRVVRHH